MPGHAEASHRTACARLRGATAATWVTVTVLSLAGAVLTVMARGDLVTSDVVTNLGAAPAAVLYVTLGALIVRRAGNVIGWFMLRSLLLPRDRDEPSAS
jgi:hypothetical protein